MAHETLIDPETLAAHLASPGSQRWVLVDCRFALGDPEAGPRAHAEGTIAGARHAHLDRDLSGPIVPGETGRHPLPTREAFVQTLGRLGIDADTQVVAFDDKGGAFASRLWWMLRWVGHAAVAVLDGGLPAWTAAGHALVPGETNVPATRFEARPSLVATADASEVLAAATDAGVVVLDARAANRYRGEDEHTDPIAGHIAGARSAPFAGNLGEGGRMRSKDELTQRFRGLLAGAEPERAIAYCGSGVTACHDLLAMHHAGLPMPRLYPGSWSEWITDESRPRATGAEP
ncbi:MAG: sulfurtransferase [Myxococcota bacterium]